MKHLKKFEDILEGKTFKDVNKKYPTKEWDPDKKEDFRKTIQDLVKSKGKKVNKVGNDFEILGEDKEVIAQILFRNDYVGVKKKGVKFVDEFKYNELGKIKSKIVEIIK